MAATPIVDSLLTFKCAIYICASFLEKGPVAEWLGSALQKLLLRFESARDLKLFGSKKTGSRQYRLPFLFSGRWLWCSTFRANPFPTIMSSRRNFLQQTATLAGALSLQPIISAASQARCDELRSYAHSKTASELETDEDFWMHLRDQFTVSPNIINLNNGGVSPQPRVVQEAHIRNYQLCNEGPSYWMWRILDQGREPLRQKIASLAGCDAEEIAINRNSTEGLNTVIFGLNLKAGDEVILNKYDYPNMMNAWRQREKREGIKLVWIDLELPIESEEYAVKQFRDALTERTRVVHITHIINWTGQLLPARKIADLAHSKGCEVIVDGAHSFAHVQDTIPETGADYYATSLHKWLCAPFGSGLLYIKKEKISGVWALLSNDKPDGDNIRKFETLGTRSFASEMAIGQAADFHQMIGSERKETRLRYLKNYWTKKVLDVPGIQFYTSLKDEWSCAIANFGLEGWKGTQVDAKLMELFKIHAVGIEWEKVNGVRITPSVYTSLYELDKLAEGITAIAKLAKPFN